MLAFFLLIMITLSFMFCTCCFLKLKISIYLSSLCSSYHTLVEDFPVTTCLNEMFCFLFFLFCVIILRSNTLYHYPLTFDCKGHLTFSSVNVTKLTLSNHFLINGKLFLIDALIQLISNKAVICATPVF